MQKGEECLRLCQHGRPCTGDSLYTEELKAGYKNTDVLPILVDFSDFSNTLPNQNIIKQYRGDDYVNFIFVGRVSPQKAGRHYYGFQLL